MAPGLVLGLKPPVRLLAGADGLEEAGRRRLRLAPGAGEGQRRLLRALAEGGATEEALCPTLELSYLLALVEREGWVSRSLVRDGRVLAVLEPLAPEFRFRPAAGEGPWRLSRLAWLRRDGAGAVLESPLGFVRVRLPAPDLLAALGRLWEPCRARDLPGLAAPLAAGFLAMLASAGAAAPCGPEGLLPEDLDPALRPWEFHDLLFHSRSRPGRHGAPAGATLRFLGELEAPPALEPARAEAIPLPEPGPAGPGPAFFHVLEARRSIRVPGPQAITLAQLGAFLHHVARVRRVLPPDPGAGRPFETALGPCPGGGALHELELYLAASRCAGLDPGFYHYAAGRHALERLAGPEAAAPLVRQAQEAMGGRPAPDILLTLAARAQRVAWKYQGIAYALILKDTGVLLQQMYLVATALGLAPCAIGTGDSEAFARAAGVDFTRAAPVGEFALSTSVPACRPPGPPDRA